MIWMRPLEKQAVLQRYMELPPPEKNGKEPFVLQHHWRCSLEEFLEEIRYVRKEVEPFILDILQREFSITDQTIFKEKWISSEEICLILEEALKHQILKAEDAEAIYKNLMKGKSVHWDFRFKVNNHLVGWSVVFDDPVIIRRDGLIEIVPIETVVKFRGRGWEIVEVKENLEVLTSNGFRKVKRAARHLAQSDLIRIVTRVGSVEVTPGHSIFLEDRSLKRADEVELGDRLLTTNELPVQEIYDVPEDWAWFLGYFCADGCATRSKQWNCKISDSDIEKLKKAQKILERYGIPTKIDGPYDGAYRLHLPLLGPLLHRLCYVHNNNTSTHRKYKIVPKLILNAKKKAKEAFLAGYYTGDGYIHKSGAKSFPANSKALALGILYLERILGRTFTASPDRKWHSLNIYVHARPREVKGYNEVTYIEKRNRGRNTYVYDLETENNEFQAGMGFLVVHNTILDNPKVPEAPKTLKEAKKYAETLPWTFKPVPGMENKKCRAEPKARQPVQWLTVEGVVEPGSIGATKHEWGLFYIVDKGTITLGAQKPYFHEYFLHGKKFKNLRLVIRATPLPRLDPETKKPIPGQYDLVWVAWIPKDQEPYAISKRAQREGWFPPKGHIPFPKYWIEKNKEKFQEWLKRAEEHWSKRKKLLKEEVAYTLHEHRWMRIGRDGKPVGIRRLPQREYLLHIYMNGKLRTWKLTGNPLWALPQAAGYEGVHDKKWLTFEGVLMPREAWNPNKSLRSKLSILAHGKAKVEVQRVNRREVILLKVRSGAMKGKWILAQEEPKSLIYTLDRVRTVAKGFELADLKAETRFVLHLHTWRGGKHYDIRIDRGSHLDEWSIKADPRLLTGEVRVNRKACPDLSWLTAEGIKEVNGKPTRLRILDSGTVDIIDDEPHFVNMEFHGETLRGLYHLILRDGQWFFGPSKLPKPVRKGEPQPQISYISRKDSWEVHLFDFRDFTSCEPDDRIPLYNPPAPPPGAKLRLCTYPRPGTIHGVKIQAIIFPKDKYTLEEIKQMDFDKYLKWSATQIRGGGRR